MHICLQEAILAQKDIELADTKANFKTAMERFEKLRAQFAEQRISDATKHQTKLDTVHKELYVAREKAANLEGQVRVMAQMNDLNKHNAGNAMEILFDKVKSAGKGKEKK